MNLRAGLACWLMLGLLASCKPPAGRTQQGGPSRADTGEASGSLHPSTPHKPAPPVLPPVLAGQTIKIVDGTRVAKGALMAVIGLTRPGDWVPSCTATLIAPDIALTAGHCFCGAHPTNGDGYVGDDASILGGLYYKIVDVKPLPTCVGSLPEGPDLAVVRLKVPVRNVTPVSFAPSALTATAKEFRVSGFGAIDRNASVYTWQKMEAKVPTISSDCTGQVGGKPLAQVYGCRPGTEIVAGQRRSPDTCSGDSGGPLLVAADGTGGAPSSPALMLSGVTSRSIRNAPQPCGSGGVYVRLTDGAKDFVAKAIASLKR